MMRKTAECYKSYAQYKRICPEMKDYSELGSSLTERSIAELQSLYTLLKKEYASLNLCEEKRTFVFENCYDDNDQGHKKAIDIVKEQQRQCLGFLTKVADELQGRYEVVKQVEEQKDLDRLVEEQLTITPSQAKRAKKKASKQRKQQNDAFKRDLQEDAEYQAALADLDHELERVARAHDDVKERFLNRLLHHIRESPSDQRYQYLYNLTEDGDEIAFYIWDSVYGDDVRNRYASEDVIRKTDISVVSDADIDQYIAGNIDDLVDLNTHDHNMVENIIKANSVYKLPNELYINIARFMLYGFVENDTFVGKETFLTSGAQRLSEILLVLIVHPTVQSLSFPKTKFNDVYAKTYLKRFGEDYMVIKDRLEKFHALMRRYFDPNSEGNTVSWYYFDGGFKRLVHKEHNLQTILGFFTIFDNTPKKVFDKLKRDVLSMYTNVKAS